MYLYTSTHVCVHLTSFSDSLMVSLTSRFALNVTRAGSLVSQNPLPAMFVKGKKKRFLIGVPMCALHKGRGEGESTGRWVGSVVVHICIYMHVRLSISVYLQGYNYSWY